MTNEWTKIKNNFDENIEVIEYMIEQRTPTKSILIAAGHSNSDPGAVNGTVYESHIVTEFRNLLSEELTNRGVTHTTDGIGDENRPLTEAIALARKHDIPIEFHCNAAAAKSATGTETLSAPEWYPLCNDIVKTISETLDIRNRGAKPENAGQHNRPGFTRAGGIIVELFFISNVNDLEKYQQNKFVLAQRLADVIIKHAQ